MGSIDERIVSIAFENSKFEANVATTLATLKKLNESLKMTGAAKGLHDIEAAANKIHLSGAGSAADKLKQKMEFSGAVKGLQEIEGASSKVTMSGAGTAADGLKGKFQSMVDSARTGLDTLREKLSFPGAEKAFSAISAAASRVNFNPIQRAIEQLNAKFGTTTAAADRSFADIERSSGKVRLSGITNAINEVGKSFSIIQGAAAVALGNIATQGAQAGFSLAKGLSITPVIGGLKEYETNLNSIQTILANTQVSGAGLKDVNKALLDLNKYSDQTIYNFSEMAKNIGTFTAAGVDLETSTKSIKGIANLAALSGSNSQQAATAMYQLSQAISSGRVSLQDWNSVVNAGMGGTVFQRALAQTAVAMGKIDESAVQLKGKMKNVTIEGQSFRESIMAKPGEESWLTSDVLTNTLQQFTGDLSKAELKAQGFNDAQIEAIQQTAKTAKLAATEVKTLSGVFDVAKETVGSGWSQTFQMIFGDFEESKKTFTGMSNAINGFINKNAEARNKVLGDWKELGGRTVLLDGVKKAFEAIGSVLKPIKDAFRDIFPPKTGKDLFDLTVKFRDLMESLKIGPETANNLKRTFAGFFAVVDIGKQIIQGFVSGLGKLLGAAEGGSGGFLNFTGSIGDFLVSVDKALKKGEFFKKFFEGLASVLAVPIKLLSTLAGAIGDLFSGGSSSAGFTKSLDGMTSSLSPLSSAVNTAKKAWDGFLDVLRKAKEALGPLVEDMVGVFGDFGDKVGEAFENMDFSKVFDVIQTTLIGGIFLTLRKALKGGGGFNIGGGDFIEGVSDTFKVLTGSLTALQNNIKAGTLLKIAGAVGILSAAVVGLSLVDPKKLASSMTAIAVGFGQLIGAMALLTKIGGLAGFIQAPIIAGSMILLAAAMDVLAIAVIALSQLSWTEIAKGLTGVGGSMVALAAGLKLMGPSVLLIGPGLIPVAIAMNILAVAVKMFGTLKWGEIGKGLVGVAGGLTAIGIGLKLIGPSVLLVGPGLIAVGIALNLLATSVAMFGKLDLKTMGKGLLGIAGSLVAIGLAVSLIPPTVGLQAAGLVILAVALNGIGVAVKMMGKMPMAELAKGLAAIGLALVVLAGGLTLMGGTIPGALALMGAATALAVLTPVIGILGKMKWGTIVKGLVAIGLALGTIGAVGAVAAPGLAAVGLAMVAVGAGVGAAGLGVNLLAKGLVLLGGEGKKGVAVMIASLTALVAIMPKIVIDFVKGLVQIVESIAQIAPNVVDAFVKIIKSILDAVIQAAPKMAEAMIALIAAMLRVINEKGPDIIDAGWKMLLALLKGVEDNIEQIVGTVGNIIAKFLTSITAQIPKIVASGANALAKFLSGIADNLDRVVKSAADVMREFLESIASKLPEVIGAAVKVVAKFIEGITSKVDAVVEEGGKLIIRIIRGVGEQAGEIVAAGVATVGRFIRGVASEIPKLADEGAKAIVNFVNGVAKAIRENSGPLGDAGANLGTAIVEGAIRGLVGAGARLIQKAKDLASSVLSALGGIFKLGSPSRATAEMGKFLVLGLSQGLDHNQNIITRSVDNLSNNTVKRMKNKLSVIPDILDGLMDVDPTITPILDLSKVQAGAKQLDTLVNVTPITAATSFGQASTIAAAQQSSLEASSAVVEGSAKTEIKFEQNNYSPESLSDVEIYRQTKNQLTQAKNALGLAS